jgi:hypothetical protein
LIESNEKMQYRKALPKILRHKYFKETDKAEKLKSDRLATKTEESESLLKYKLGAVLGQGSYAIVKMGQYSSGELFAIKTYEKNKLKDIEKR